MPWKESDSNKEGPPDLQELISGVKERIKSSFKSKNKKSSNLTGSNETLPEQNHSCPKDKREYFIELFLKCAGCDKVIKYRKITNPYKVAALLVIISYGASQFIDYAVTDNRYPLDVEYAVMDSCTNSYEKPMVRRAYGKKKAVCLCALEDTMNEISYMRYQVDEKGFLNAFEENAVNCIEQQK